jgi:hypothetical protein
VKLRENRPGSAPREFEEKCDLLLHATGILNNFKWPEIEGLEKFKGKVVRKLRSILFRSTPILQTLRNGRRTIKRNSGRTNRLQSLGPAHLRSKLCLICSHLLNISTYMFAQLYGSYRSLGTTEQEKFIPKNSAISSEQTPKNLLSMQNTLRLQSTRFGACSSSTVRSRRQPRRPLATEWQNSSRTRDF